MKVSELTLLVWWWQLNREWQKKIGYIDFYKIFTNVNVVLIAVKTFRGLKQGRRCMTLMNLRTLCDVFPVPVGKWKQYRMVGLVKQNKIKQSFVWKIKARKKSENCIYISGNCRILFCFFRFFLTSCLFKPLYERIS